ncbi:hypothetical protein L1987_81924 [Smallanthus sonchifolius]|uniref:Uncharacterized protein n=1 Tax=Smallanthus sonchifolius TaxID=185202 RepID=A0ACB8YR29_9ASTR|nr:hypothetical protein L1987_81924 [Smallanthus sonchifolius]
MKMEEADQGIPGSSPADPWHKALHGADGFHGAVNGWCSMEQPSLLIPISSTSSGARSLVEGGLAGKHGGVGWILEFGGVI